MQRLYVMFPDRAPGIGLLWMRLCLAASLCLSIGSDPWHTAGSLVVAALVAAGWLTLPAVLLATAIMLWTGPLTALVVLPLGLLLLGPGAYSLDACSFGRRVVDLVGVGRNPKE
ncbi:TPA: hypothetical protein QDZ34_000393 [Stenotrophomonas maltophilia]|nr:hypothetical protein [Stenotrophomonas maltophilia]HDS1024234.1 hypothetical protein [Stenotrophomonas maltophilia]HDS1028702.1 hypothetical protein [Stenotrophomonas maltophilia]HDS1033090.1 hypothetical protein [Stenotrophomonas maltophilia]HDS1037455.1 hypothetical protein [Stenotrophomonas maltophilia]